MHGMGWWRNICSGTDPVRNRRSIRELASRRADVRLDQLAGAGATAPPPELDLCVVTHNNGKWIDAFCSSLLQQSYPVDRIYLIAVDNASTDETVQRWEAARHAYGGALRGMEVLTQANRGFGSGHNLAASRGSAPWLVVTNVDLEFEPDAIANAMQRALAAPPRTVAWEFRQKPYEHPRYYDPVTLETACSSHACVMLRRSAFEEVGGYDEHIFLYGEDIELSFRLRDHGYRLQVCPNAVVWHYCYEHAAAFKAHQYFGSGLTRCLNRLRYDALWNIPAVLTECRRLRDGSRRIPDGRAYFRRTMRHLLALAPHFLLHRKRSRLAFPFRPGWYELRREGAFYEHTRRTDPHGGAAPATVTAVVRVRQPASTWLREALVTLLHQTHAVSEIVILYDPEHVQLDDIPGRIPGRARAVAVAAGDEAAAPRAVAGRQSDAVLTMTDTVLLFADHVEVTLAALRCGGDNEAAAGLTWTAPARLSADGRTTFELGYGPGADPAERPFLMTAAAARTHGPNDPARITTVEKTTAIVRQPGP